MARALVGPAPFLLVHGSFHGGWCWRLVARLLRAAGHEVFTPTLTGLGERRHLLGPEISLGTFVTDIIGVLEAEELEHVVLVGHRFGGNVALGVADQMPRRLRHLVLLDGSALHNDESFADVLPERAAELAQAAEEHDGGVSVPPPPAASFGIPEGPLADWVGRRLTPMPFACLQDPLTLSYPLGNHRPRTYVECSGMRSPAGAASSARLRDDPGWHWRTLEAGEEAMVTAPEALAALLLEIARG
jgi:pimeloyl-ACP methyl ester carboxylesterase